MVKNKMKFIDMNFRIKLILQVDFYIYNIRLFFKFFIDSLNGMNIFLICLKIIDVNKKYYK